ncbi:LysR family transcriptional regulator [Shewanella surugensis]|uniref:LysR family transcriptional regulator n=1 Tax=Shewanella surugensis TaxID=212020 RepID=A0ABT0LHZ9_9GAMM|nr:LysR family transcriptional regulator [Shewanella surugensis]MCL1127337.1 LysR family transcriptional regulator [Shewanella surugensis]
MMQVNWDDFRIALQVAQSGTLTRAGSVLNMNHTTVLRRLNQLEAALSIKLFIRHQRGYQLTDAGKMMLTQLPEIGSQFNRLIDDLSSVDQNHHGHLRITTLNGYAPLLNQALEGFRGAYPKTCIQMIVTEKTIPIESGVTHIAIRVGPQPIGPDIIVKKLMNLNVDYYASNDYIEKYGLPRDPLEYNQHFWAMPSGIKQSITFVKDVLQHLKNEQIIYQSNLFTDLHSVVVKGIAIGSMTEYEAKQHKNLQALELDFKQEEEVLWFVYHKDLKHNPKINAFYQYLLESLS